MRSVALTVLNLNAMHLMSVTLTALNLNATLLMSVALRNTADKFVGKYITSQSLNKFQESNCNVCYKVQCAERHHFRLFISFRYFDSLDALLLDCQSQSDYFAQ